MIEKPSLSDHCIIECLITHYGIPVTTLTFLPLGADENAAVYKADAKKSSYFVKLKKNHHELSALIQTVLHDAGIQQIIAPLKTLEGQLTQLLQDFTLTVYPFIEGHDGFSRSLTDDQWIILGKAMRRIHEVELPSFIQHEIKQETYSPHWRTALRSLYTQLDTVLLSDEIAVKLLAYMKEKKDIIERLVERADQLAQKIQNHSHPLVLCHSDIHAGNVLIAENGTLFIVDWDQPMLAPKERDLMFMGGGIGNVWNNPQEEELFYKGYENTEINHDILAYYRHERIVEDIAFYAQQLLLSSSGGKDRAVMYQHFIALFEPRGVVEIAFASDKDL